jgi:metal-dependent amidase/aminoacylase/carboxypeptidase family protein
MEKVKFQVAKIQQAINEIKDMENEVDYKTEIEPLLKEKTEEDISLEFLDEFNKLCKKYQRTFAPEFKTSIVKVNLPND